VVVVFEVTTLPFRSLRHNAALLSIIEALWNNPVFHIEASMCSPKHSIHRSTTRPISRVDLLFFLHHKAALRITKHKPEQLGLPHRRVDVFARLPPIPKLRLQNDQHHQCGRDIPPYAVRIPAQSATTARLADASFCPDKCR
jgi:hypothetical protein